MSMKAMNVKFSDESADALVRIADDMGTSKADALRFGLALLRLAFKEERDGNKIGIIRDGAVVREIVSVWNQR